MVYIENSLNPPGSVQLLNLLIIFYCSLFKKNLVRSVPAPDYILKVNMENGNLILQERVMWENN